MPREAMRTTSAVSGIERFIDINSIAGSIICGRIHLIINATETLMAASWPGAIRYTCVEQFARIKLLSMQAHRYAAAILKRSYTETIHFWSVHRNWTFAAPIVTGAIVMLYKSDPMWIKKSFDFAEYTGISYLVAWGGTFLVNLVRAPKLLHDEATANMP